MFDRNITMLGIIMVPIGQLDIYINPEFWEGYEPENGEIASDDPANILWDMKLTMFQKLIVVKSFMEEKVSFLLAP